MIGRLAPAALVLAGAIVYANALTGPFIFDDQGSIVDNPHLRRLWPLTWAMSAPPQATVAGRPLVSLSLALNYAVGGLEVRGYHLTNVALHLLCALLLYGVVFRTLCGTRLGVGRARGWAVSTALIWTVHPLCTETVNYVVQRTEGLMALFYLGALYAAIRAWGERRGAAWSAVAVVSCAAGMACKESMVTAPLAVLLHDLAYRPEPWRAIVRRRLPLYAALAATWAVLAALVLGGPRSDTVGLSLGVTALDYLRHQAVTITEYLKTAFWPHPLVMDYGYVRPLAVSAVPYLFLIGGLAALAAFLLWWRPRIGFPAVWFFLVLAPTSSVVPIVSEVGAERRMYLPLAGLIALVVAAVGWALERLARRRPASAAPLVVGVQVTLLAAVFLGWTTRVRNEDYKDAVALWKTAVAARPDNPRAYNNLGQAVHRQDSAKRAEYWYRQALERDPDYAQARFNLGVSLAEQGEWWAAMDEYRRTLELDPGSARAEHNLGSVLANRGRLAQSLSHFERAVQLAPEWPTGQHSLGRALRLLHRSAEATAHLREAARLDPEHWESRSDLAWILATDPDPTLRDPEQAVRLAEEAVALTGRRHAIALDTLAAAEAAAGRFDAAVATASEAIDAASGEQTRREIAARRELYRRGEAYRTPADG